MPQAGSENWQTPVIQTSAGPRQFSEASTEPTSPSRTLPGLMQALGAFLLYFTVYAQQGFWPTSLFNLRVEWETDEVNDLEDTYGQEWVSWELCH